MTTSFLDFRGVLAAIALSITCLAASAQDFRVVRYFTGGTNDSGPGTIVLEGSTFYGVTFSGGTNNLGTVYRMNQDGSGFAVIHSFVSPATDGQRPMGPLVVSEGMLYGTATSEDSGYGGTVFKLGTNGSNFQVLRSFSTSDGMWPYGSVIKSGPVLYGFNTYGGSASGWNGRGTVFQIDTNGSGFGTLRTFAGGSSDGSAPHGSPIQSGTNLFGTTLWGGTSGNGTVFKIGTNGTGFQILHSFAGGTNDGAWPYCTLALAGSTLYGIAAQGGISNQGAIFRVDTDGNNYQVLHRFAGGANDGSASYGPMSLLVDGSILYGATDDGGSNNVGVVFQIGTNGTGFKVLRSFTGGTDGSSPGSLILNGSTLYGTSGGGGGSYQGLIFAIDLPVPTLAISKNGTNVNLSWNTNCPDYTLESTDQLNNAWTPVTGVTGYSATVPLGPVTNQFFRLRK